MGCSEQGHFDHAAAPAANIRLDQGAAQHEGRSDRVAEAERLGEEREGGGERARLAQRRHRDRRHRRDERRPGSERGRPAQQHECHGLSRDEKRSTGQQRARRDARSPHGYHPCEALVEHELLHGASLLQHALLIVAERRVAHERDQEARTAAQRLRPARLTRAAR
eukprot:scaffold64882_cov75-Phaeocystis_antarctica.AAC.4